MPPSVHFRSILCAVDFSPASRAAMAAAIELARRFESKVTLIHVYESLLLGPPTAGEGSIFRVSMADLAHEELGKWQREAEQRLGYGVTAVVCEGVPWDAITRQAEERRADLVVMGTHGRTGLEHVLVGSVAERVVRHCTRPVLVIREARP